MKQTKQKQVQQYYGNTLQTSQNLQTNACSCVSQLPKQYRQTLKQLHPQVTKKFYGCGSPIPQQIKNCTILDLGCGGGRDCFIASKAVGQNGYIIGIDMTEKMIKVAIQYQQYHWKKYGYSKTNMCFRAGRIQDLKSLDIKDNSIDVVISNCVINLLPSKSEIFKQIWRVLKPGGQLYFSDVYSDRRIPQIMQKDKVLWGECLSGALYLQDFRRQMQQAGFKDLRLYDKSVITVNNKQIQGKLKKINFYSCTYRAFKLDLQDRGQDYGHKAVYNGKGCNYKLDINYNFIKGQQVKICRNTAKILSDSRLADLFVVSDQQEHKGVFQFNQKKQKKCC